MIRAVGRAFVGDGELTERQGAILVAGSGVAFSVTAIAFRGVERASDFQFLTYRGLSTALVMVLLIIVRRSGRPVSFAGVSWRTWAAALVLAVTSMLYILALSRTSAATTLFLLAAAPVFAAIIGWVLLRERVEQSTLIAIGITAVGVTIMVGAGLDAGSALGLFFAALIPVLVGLYSVIQRSVSRVDPVIPTLIAAVFLTLGSGVIALSNSGLGVSGRDLTMAVISGGFAMGLGLPLFNLGHRSVAAARIPLLIMTEVVLAPLWVWIWPGETPDAGTLIGGAVIMSAVAWLMLRTRRSDLPRQVVAPT
ncbi:DMT family transporter [uncultured Ilumatobacter sp.]|uniref:DMT family transporter n=1 Tax=uncultured Ilumatobacter sp. TaxID=879968 RepID=UPI00374E6718